MVDIWWHLKVMKTRRLKKVVTKVDAMWSRTFASFTKVRCSMLKELSEEGATVGSVRFSKNTWWHAWWFMIVEVRRDEKDMSFVKQWFVSVCFYHIADACFQSRSWFKRTAHVFPKLRFLFLHRCPRWPCSGDLSTGLQVDWHWSERLHWLWGIQHFLCQSGWAAAEFSCNSTPLQTSFSRLGERAGIVLECFIDFAMDAYLWIFSGWCHATAYPYRICAGFPTLWG